MKHVPAMIILAALLLVPPAHGESSSPSTQHWAFQPIQKPLLEAAAGANPVDVLFEKKPAVRADARTLLRRMTYDLTGLPPTSAETERFVRELGDAREDRHEIIRRTIDRLLASPAYGEKWGRKWLDLARYADTAGENTDRPVHNAWRYRNYVIAAYNRDMPYDEFLREQIAGDLLASGNPERYGELVTATGYLAIARRFGHDIDKDMHLTYEDVIDTIGKSVLGLTLGCARCHNHKYDPVPTTDYYALYGIFASTKFAFPGCEPSQKPRDMMPLWSSKEMASRRKPFDEQVGALDRTIEQLKVAQTNVASEFIQFAAPHTVLLAKGEFDDGGAQPLFPEAHPLTVGAGEMVKITVFPRANYGADTTLLELHLEESGGEHRKWDLAGDLADDFLEANPHSDRFGHAVAWSFLDARGGLQLLAEAVADHMGKKGLNLWRNGDNPAAFVNASREPIAVWTKLPPRSFFVHPASNGPVAVAWIAPFTGTVLVSGKVADAHPGGGDGVAWTLEHVAAPTDALMTKLAQLNRQLRAPLQQRAALLAREPQPPLAYAVTEGKPADIPLQKRGDPEQAGEIIPRKNLGLLGGEAIRDPSFSGRLDLAKWLTAPENPLTARVMANRIWQGHFGRGIVSTPSDFGARGAVPTHPQLLDWLAATFIDSGWSIKAMHRIIMNSESYQARDFGCRRLEAEEIRDTLLAVCGELDVIPGEGHPFPSETATFTQHNPFKAVYSSRKRSVYLMTQRIQRHPFLALFDGPDTNASSATRGSSTVPTQSLYFLNDPFFHECSESFARRLITVEESTRIKLAHQLAFQRDPDQHESLRGTEFVSAYRAALRDIKEVADPELAAWSAYARSLLASNELLYVE